MILPGNKDKLLSIFTDAGAQRAPAQQRGSNLLTVPYKSGDLSGAVRPPAVEAGTQRLNRRSCSGDQHPGISVLRASSELCSVNPFLL